MVPGVRLPLSERLRPTRLDDLIGNPQARAQLRGWAEKWLARGTPAQRAAILSGPPGVGKTSAALALAADMGWSVVEMNASDARNERAIEQVAGRASISHTLLDGPRRAGPSRSLILLDEADSLSGRATESARPAPSPPTLKEFLRGRYGAIEALNQTWGLVPGGKPAAFGSWDSVPKSPGNFAWARLASARKDLDDWRSAGRPADTSDRGGLGAIARLLRSTRQPLVLTVNDERVLTRYSAAFRTSALRVRFYPLRDPEMNARLTAIARDQVLDVSPEAISAIVRRANGDLRAALNDLDAIAPVPRGPLQLSILGTRDTSADFAALTEEALTAARYYRSVEVQDRLDATPDDLLPWIEENIPFFAPDPAHRARAFERLSSADRALRRARQYRVWGLWSYASELMTGGVSLAIREAPGRVPGGAQFPRFLGEMGRSRATRAVRESIVRKAGARLHLSRAKSREEVLPFFEAVFEVGPRGRSAANPELARRIVRELDLSLEEIAYLVDAEIDAAVVQGLADRDAVLAPEPSPSEADPAPGTRTADRDRRGVQRQLSDFGSR